MNRRNIFEFPSISNKHIKCLSAAELSFQVNFHRAYSLIELCTGQKFLTYVIPDVQGRKKLMKKYWTPAMQFRFYYSNNTPNETYFILYE